MNKKFNFKIVSTLICDKQTVSVIAGSEAALQAKFSLCRKISVLSVFIIVISFMVLVRLNPAYAAEDSIWGGLEWGDLILEKSYQSMKKAKVSKVVFPHWFHRIRFRCKACHEKIFKMKRGSNNINMSGIIKGKWCGKCHDGKTAFAPVECSRCHSYDEETIEQGAILGRLEKKIRDNEELFITAGKLVEESRDRNARYLLDVSEQLRELSKKQMVKGQYKMAIESYKASTEFAASAIKLTESAAD